MKRLTALFTDHTEANLAFILHMAKEEAYELQGLFLRHLKPTPALQYPFASDLSLTQTPVIEVITGQEDLTPAQHRLNRVQQQCNAAGVPFSGTILPDASLDDLIFQTAFADLLLLDAGLILEEYVISPLNVSLQDALIRSHCPVLVVPTGAAQPQKTILAYDAHHSTLFAIRMYTYLLAQNSRRPTQLVTVNRPDNPDQQPADSLQHWLQQRFSHLDTVALRGKVREELVQFIQQQSEPVLVVMSAYGGDALSRLFHESIASTVLKQTRAMLFITHQ